MLIDKYLEEIQMIDSKIANKMYEMEVWKDIANGSSGSSNGERVQSTSSQQKMANAVAKYTDIEREIEELKQKKIDFIHNIEKLSRTHYLLMHDIYIKGLSQTEVARNNKKSPSWASTIHSRAKMKLCKIMWGDKG